MDKEKKTTETNDQTIVSDESANDAEARIKALEEEKAKLIEEKANYQVAYLKEKKKNSSEEIEETEDEKIQRIIEEKLSNTRIAQIDKEKEELLQKTLKENKELKLAQLNKNTVVASKTSSSEETMKVQDTSITPEQLEAFKARGWTDKDIERYKKNLSRYR